MIKRILSILLAVAMVLSLGACAEQVPDHLTKETYKQGKAALKVMDQYLAGKTDADAAENQLSKIADKLDEEANRLSEKSASGDMEALGYSFFNSSVSLSVSSFVMGMYGWANAYGNTYDCQSVRDGLADTLELD